MTGGWRPFADNDLSIAYAKPRVVVLSAEEVRVDAMVAVLLDAARFKRRARRLLRQRGLKFTEWRLLRGTHRAQRETGDAVSFQLAARFAGMDHASASCTMTRLNDRGLVDIGPDASGWSYRVIVTQEGREVLTGAEKALAQSD